MGADQGGQVEIGEDVAVEGQEAVVESVGELGGGEPDRAGRAQRLRLGDVADPDAGTLLLAGECLAQDIGQEPTREDDLGDAVGGQPLDRVGEQRPVDQGEGRLRDSLCQRPEPRSLPTDEDDRLH